MGDSNSSIKAKPFNVASKFQRLFYKATFFVNHSDIVGETMQNVQLVFDAQNVEIFALNLRDIHSFNQFTP